MYRSLSIFASGIIWCQIIEDNYFKRPQSTTMNTNTSLAQLTLTLSQGWAHITLPIDKCGMMPTPVGRFSGSRPKDFPKTPSFNVLAIRSNIIHQSHWFFKSITLCLLVPNSLSTISYSSLGSHVLAPLFAFRYIRNTILLVVSLWTSDYGLHSCMNCVCSVSVAFSGYCRMYDVY